MPLPDLRELEDFRPPREDDPRPRPDDDFALFEDFPPRELLLAAEDLPLRPELLPPPLLRDLLPDDFLPLPDDLREPDDLPPPDDREVDFPEEDFERDELEPPPDDFRPMPTARVAALATWPAVRFAAATFSGFCEDLPATAPSTPPTTAPTGPTMLPSAAPAAAPAASLEMDGIGRSEDDWLLPCDDDPVFSCSAIRMDC
ncbi:MAG: hypothetical protein ACJ8KX_11080 [Chthoniobacterales bacterium]